MILIYLNIFLTPLSWWYICSFIRHEKKALFIKFILQFVASISFNTLSDGNDTFKHVIPLNKITAIESTPGAHFEGWDYIETL